jgi:hypothetical protein
MKSNKGKQTKVARKISGYWISTADPFTWKKDHLYLMKKKNYL